MNRDIEHYLKRATRGLWGRKRQEVREELTAHIEGRVEAHRIAGLNAHEAVQKTLHELGEPGVVRAGMTQLYTLPMLMLSSLFAALVCTFALLMWSDSVAQTLSVTDFFPSHECLQEQRAERECRGGLWIRVDTLEEALSPYSVAFKFTGNSGMTLTFPDGDTAFISLRHPDYNSPDNPPETNLDENYLNLNTFIDELESKTDLPIRLEGITNPVLHVGDLAIHLTSTDAYLPWYALYRHRLWKALDAASGEFWTWGSEDITTLDPRPGLDIQPTRISAGHDGVGVYGVVSAVTPDDLATVQLTPTLTIYGKSFEILETGTVAIELGEGFELWILEGIQEAADVLKARPVLPLSFITEVAESAPDGSVVLSLPPQPHFVSSFFGDIQPSDVMLVRLDEVSSGLGFEIIPPEEIRLE